MQYKIEFLKEIDSDNLRDFIDKEFAEGHVLSRSKKLFDWQYKNDNGTYNFVVLKIKNTISGILGFIPTYRYDKNLITKNIIWLALWKISEKVEIAGIGLKMLVFLQNNIDHIGIAVNGIGESLPLLYRGLGYDSNEMSHYYVTNNKSNMKLISSPKNYSHPTVKKSGFDWEILDAKNIKNMIFSENKFNLSIPKTTKYFLNKYIKHPFYNYSVYLIFDEEKNNSGLISIRFDEKEDSKVLRIIDYLGDPHILKFSGCGLQKIMSDFNIEYADFWSYGISDKIMNNIGFKKVNPNKNIIVPSYYEPFVNANIRILFAFKNTIKSKKHTLIFKGDGDQDRPNLTL